MQIFNLDVRTVGLDERYMQGKINNTDRLCIEINNDFGQFHVVYFVLRVIDRRLKKKGRKQEKFTLCSKTTVI